MKEFFGSLKFKILICIAALLLGLMTYIAVSGGFQTVPEVLLNGITSPFVSAANSISDWANGLLDTLVNADSYKEENDILNAQLTEMYKKTKDYEELKDENALLREMLGLRRRTTALFSPSPVMW